ncbi:thermonuclease family protein [Longispora sp. K20-0274]|uniref:thermonuclease family protein n=1 Tax=Longispora sp. K20-0274 TaxID=3088255 RepID=UPI00399A5AC3
MRPGATFVSVALVVAFSVGAWFLVRWLVPEEDPPLGQRATVVAVRDGDTLELRADAGGPVLAAGETVQARLIGIDTPELHGADDRPECYATEARDALARLAPRGGTVYVTADEERLDRYQRRLVYVWTEAGVLVNERLARDGFARRLTIPPNDRHDTAITRAITEATARHRGLWQTCQH